MRFPAWAGVPDAGVEATFSTLIETGEVGVAFSLWGGAPDAGFGAASPALSGAGGSGVKFSVWGRVSEVGISVFGDFCFAPRVVGLVVAASFRVSSDANHIHERQISSTLEKKTAEQRKPLLNLSYPPILRGETQKMANLRPLPTRNPPLVSEG